MNYIRLESSTDSKSGGGSYSDPSTPTKYAGSNTGYWSTDQIATNLTTETHEYNHAAGGLYHPEGLNPSGGNHNETPSIDMTVNSYNYVKDEYIKSEPNSQIHIDVTKRTVQQKNISSLFNPKVIEDLKTSGKANVGTLTNIYHAK